VGWHIGFYPGTDPGAGRNGVGTTFDEAKAGFEAAWLQFLPTRTEADFREWRDERDWTVRKYAMWARGKRLLSQIAAKTIELVGRIRGLSVPQL
jgi:hypothetical protein